MTEHVSSVRRYALIYFALLALLAATVGAHYAGFGTAAAFDFDAGMSFGNI